MGSGYNQKNKQRTLAELAAMVPDGASIALGAASASRAVRLRARTDPAGQARPGTDQAVARLRRGHPVPRRRVAPRARGHRGHGRQLGLAPWYRKAIERGEVELEEHACASLTAGLRAAAFGVPFQPCGGLHGSGLPELNGWKCIDDPYGSGQRTWVVPAVRPDFAVIQASEIDAQGNVRVSGTAHWDRIMSRAAGSVLVVAEKQVDSAVFEAQPESTLVPYFMVQAMPWRRAAPGLARAGRPTRSTTRPSRPTWTRTANWPPTWRRRRKRRRPAMAEQWSGFSYIVTNLARFIRPDEITFSGVNSTMPMLACLLAKRAYDWDYVYINVAGGVDPRPSHVPLSSSDPVLAEHTASIFANEDFYDLCTRGRMDLTFLGAAQIDGEGCANNSCIGDWHAPKVRLPGGGGGAVMLPTARRACTWRTEHSTRTLVPRLDFVTSWGGFHGVVTPIAVFIKRDGRLALQSWHPQASLAEVRERTGFEFDASGAAPTEPPTPAEARALRELDPEGQFERDAAVTLR